jgi:hypothetical protein
MDGVLGGKWEKMQREVALLQFKEPNCKQICRLGGVMLGVLTCYWTQSLRARRWVFKGDKISRKSSFGEEVKPSVT